MPLMQGPVAAELALILPTPKDDTLSQPHLVLIQRCQGLQLRTRTSEAIVFVRGILIVSINYVRLHTIGMYLLTL